MTTAAQTRAIHALRRSIPHFGDEDYRALLRREFRLSSSRLLSELQAGKLIDMLKVHAGKYAHARPAGATADGPFAGKLRALWIAAWNLGLARDRDDRALIAFVKRQTGFDHTRFLADATDAAKAIEGLKKWLARDGGVIWPKTSASPLEVKRAVALAVARRCVETGAFEPFCAGSLESDLAVYGFNVAGLPRSLDAYEADHFDRLASRLGARLRARLARRRREAEDATCRAAS